MQENKNAETNINSKICSNTLVYYRNMKNIKKLQTFENTNIIKTTDIIIYKGDNISEKLYYNGNVIIELLYNNQKYYYDIFLKKRGILIKYYDKWSYKIKSILVKPKEDITEVLTKLVSETNICNNDLYNKMVKIISNYKKNLDVFLIRKNIYNDLELDLFVEYNTSLNIYDRTENNKKGKLLFKYSKKGFKIYNNSNEVLSKYLVDYVFTLKRKRVL